MKAKLSTLRLIQFPKAERFGGAGILAPPFLSPLWEVAVVQFKGK